MAGECCPPLSCQCVRYPSVSILSLTSHSNSNSCRLELVCIANKSVVCQEKIAGEKVSPVCYMALNPVSMAIMVCREQLIWIYNIVDETRCVGDKLWLRGGVS